MRKKPEVIREPESFQDFDKARQKSVQTIIPILQLLLIREKIPPHN